jgi:hypothetical protein
VRKPPPGTEPLTLEIPSLLADRVRAFADREMRSVKSVVILALEHYLRKYEEKGTTRTSMREILHGANETVRKSVTRADDVGRSKSPRRHSGEGRAAVNKNAKDEVQP